LRAVAGGRALGRVEFVRPAPADGMHWYVKDPGDVAAPPLHRLAHVDYLSIGVAQAGGLIHRDGLEGGGAATQPSH